MGLLRNLYDFWGQVFYRLAGRKPWSFGYTAYKRKKIIEYLSSHKFNAEGLSEKYGYRLDERIVEYPWLFSRLPDTDGVLLDAGSVMNYDYLLEQSVFRNKKLYISTLSPEHNCFWEEGISYIFEDLRNSSYRNDLFDWVVCLSTIEHIGMDNTFLYTQDKSKKEEKRSDYLIAINEMKRILKPGGTLFLSFPFGAKMDHGWFQVFDDAMVRELIEAFSPAQMSESCFAYKATGWQISSREKSAAATYFDINRKKRYDPDYAAAARSVLCLELVK